MATTPQTRCSRKINKLATLHRLKWPAPLEFGGASLFERYNVVSFASQSRTLNIKEGISLKTLHQAFYGACALLIGMCKPVREENYTNSSSTAWTQSLKMEVPF